MEDISQIILNDEASFVLSNSNEIVVKDSSIGVKPIISIIDNDASLLNNADVADKIIGKAAALLLCRYNVKSVFAKIISKPAILVLEKYNIPYSYSHLVDNIKNRTNTDICPLEKSVINIEELPLAETAIRNTISQLMQNKTNGN
ncbi:MAG: DUF1893 domain-containing protein [Clostridia bacterium]